METFTPINQILTFEKQLCISNMDFYIWYWLGLVNSAVYEVYINCAFLLLADYTLWACTNMGTWLCVYIGDYGLLGCNLQPPAGSQQLILNSTGGQTLLHCDKNLKKIAVKLALHSIAAKLFIDMFYNCRLAMLFILFQSCCAVATFISSSNVTVLRKRKVNHNPPPHIRFKTAVTVSQVS